MTQRPDYLCGGEAARLFPTLAITSKEGRSTSILLACLTKINEFAHALLGSIGQRIGPRACIETYTEPVFKGQRHDEKSYRPDGLIVVRIGAREWRALVETKVGKSLLNEEQIETYRELAKIHKVDCVITISNQFTSLPQNHPLSDVRKSRSKIPVYHWSWMYILTTAHLLSQNNSVADASQTLLLNELCRFLSHESSGVKGFDRMPREWSELTRRVKAGDKISARALEVRAVLEAWHQETKDLALILSRQTETFVREKLPRNHIRNSEMRLKDELEALSEKSCMYAKLDIPNAASSLDITCNVARQTIAVGMNLRAPEDKKVQKRV